MAAFDAADIAEPLRYTFAPYADKAGTIREPTDKQITRFQADIRREMLRALRELGAAPALTNEAIQKLTPDEFAAALEKTDLTGQEATLKRQAKIYSDLCSGDPAPADLLAVPLRVRLAWQRWLQGEVINPEAAGGAGRSGKPLTLVPPQAG